MEAIGSNIVNVSRRVAEIQALLDIAPVGGGGVSPDLGTADFARTLSTALTAGTPALATAGPSVSGVPGAIPAGYGALIPLAALGLGTGAPSLITSSTTPTTVPAAGAPAPSATAVRVPASTVPPPSNEAALRVAFAAAEIGVAEAPAGSDDAPRIAEYRTATAGAGVGPWCAYFTSWVGAKAGTPLGPDGSGEGYVPTMASWLRRDGRYVEPSEGKQPRPGDLVFFDWERDGELDHIGLVQSVGADGRIYTIEGNASNAVKQRSWSPSQIAGYGLLP